MPARPPPDDFMRAAAARAQQRRQTENERQSSAGNRFRWVVWVFAAVLLVALMADLKGVSRRVGAFRQTGQPAARKGDAADLAAGLDGARYADPQGRFSLVPPRNWIRVRKPVDGFFDAVFQGPYGMDMSIQVVTTNGMTFDRLVDQLKQVERRLSADTHMDFAYVGPYRAVKRSVQLFRSRVLLLDFVTGDLMHHVQFSTPPQLYDEYEPVFLRLMQTYAPGRVLEAPAPGPAP